MRRTVRWYLEHAEWVADVRSGEYRKWMDANYGARGATNDVATSHRSGA
jgi:dTDP-glucose 4,6-dehydratase